MPYEASQSFFIAKADGSGETFVAKGDKFPDNHPIVRADTTGTLFRRMTEHDPYVDPDAPSRPRKSAA